MKTIIKYFLVLTIIFVGLFTFVINQFFLSIKSNIIDDYSSNIDVTVKYSNTQLTNLMIENRHNDIILFIDKLIKQDKFYSIELVYDRMIFTKNSLLLNTQNFKDKNWSIDGVSVDASYGLIHKIANTQYYEYMPIKKRSDISIVNIKYQAFNEYDIKNLLATLNFSKYFQQNKNNIQSNIPNFLYKYFKVTINDINQKLSINNYHFGTILYKPNTIKLENEIYNIFVKLLILCLLLFFPITLFILWYFSNKQKKYFLDPLDEVNLYLDNIEHNKYIKLDKEYENEQINSLVKHIDTLSSKVAKSINELNMNKQVLELKLSSDSITGLPNQNRFELDIKRMFISSLDGFVMLIKIDNLTKISKENSSFFTNAYIKEVAYTLKNIVDTLKQYDLTLYRFHGSEFALIAKKVEQNDVNFICTQLTNKLEVQIPQKYKIIENMINIGITPFDKYGTMDSIMDLAQEAHSIAYEKPGNAFHIIDFKPLELKYNRLEDEILKIIDEGNFNIDLKYDTYSFDDNTLLMQEVIPKLTDHNGDPIAIGSFVAIAQSIHKIVEFDILNIKKSIEYIHEKDIKHALVINLSIETISSAKFINWLIKELDRDAKIHNKLIFSITSYAASIHKVRFKSFVNQVKDLDVEMLIKRYNPNEFTFDDLENLPIDYIRIHQDYTMGMLHDTIKKHRVKDIIIFAELNDIKILCDSISNEEEYKYLDRLGAYGTSR